MKIEFIDASALPFQMLSTVVDWLRDQPVSDSPGPFSNIQKFAIQPDNRVHPHAIDAVLDNGASLTCINYMEGAAGSRPRALAATCTLYATEDKTQPAIKNFEGTFDYQRLDSGNKRLIFIPRW